MGWSLSGLLNGAARGFQTLQDQLEQERANRARQDEVNYRHQRDTIADQYRATDDARQQAQLDAIEKERQRNEARQTGMQREQRYNQGYRPAATLDPANGDASNAVISGGGASFVMPNLTRTPAGSEVDPYDPDKWVLHPDLSLAAQEATRKAQEQDAIRRALIPYFERARRGDASAQAYLGAHNISPSQYMPPKEPREPREPDEYFTEKGTNIKYRSVGHGPAEPVLKTDKTPLVVEVPVTMSDIIGNALKANGLGGATPPVAGSGGRVGATGRNGAPVVSQQPQQPPPSPYDAAIARLKTKLKRMPTANEVLAEMGGK